MRVRVVRKLADRVDGIDLSHCIEGDVIDLSDREASVIIAERWALPARRATDSIASVSGDVGVRSSGHGRRLGRDRRMSSRLTDLHQRFGDKRQETDRDRRSLYRRATDDGQGPIVHTAA